MLTILISVFSVLVIPALAMLIRITVKWQRVEDRLSNMTEDLTTLVKDKTEAHRELYKLMRSDREAMDRRVRWLEQNFWKRPAGGRNSGDQH